MAKNRADTDNGLEVILEKAVVAPYTRKPQLGFIYVRQMLNTTQQRVKEIS